MMEYPETITLPRCDSEFYRLITGALMLSLILCAGIYGLVYWLANVSDAVNMVAVLALCAVGLVMVGFMYASMFIDGRNQGLLTKRAVEQGVQRIKVLDYKLSSQEGKLVATMKLEDGREFAVYPSAVNYVVTEDDGPTWLERMPYYQLQRYNGETLLKITGVLNWTNMKLELPQRVIEQNHQLVSLT